MPVDRRVDVREGRLPGDVVRGDAVDAGVAGVELVARVEQRLPIEDLAAVPKADDPDLADAADARAVSTSITTKSGAGTSGWSSPAVTGAGCPCCRAC